MTAESPQVRKTAQESGVEMNAASDKEKTAERAEAARVAEEQQKEREKREEAIRATDQARIAEIKARLGMEHADIPKLEKANIVGIARDRNFEGSIIVKTADEEGRITGYAIRKDSQGNYEGNEIRYMKDGSIGPVYQLREAGFAKLKEQGVLDAYENAPEMEERDIQSPELLDAREASKKFLAEERSALAQEIREQRRAQRERLAILKNDIEEARDSSESLEGAIEDNQYAQLAEMQSTEATMVAERIPSARLSESELSDEQENIRELIGNSEAVRMLKSKLEEHYLKANEEARKRFESVQKSVEHTALRNGAFFVHTIQESSIKRHNELSNVSSRSTYEDDVDILLSLEPTISASSIFSGRSQEGKISGLWSNTGGLILGGGEIRYASRNDLDSKSAGIKSRVVAGEIENQSVADIDNVVSKRGEAEILRKTYDGVQKIEQGSDYNEFIVDNPKVFGYYQSVGVIEDEDFADGKYWAGEIETKYEYEEISRMKRILDKIQQDPSYFNSSDVTPEKYQGKLVKFQERLHQYKERFEMMASKGTPLYIMTPDRSMYEYLGINEDGSVNIGRQLTVEEAATGRAGLSTEKRKELGNKVLQKQVFKEEGTRKEAAEIINHL
ncbi:MAG TPA: hypothetical protein VF829_00475 [Candidatus Paceibacterota bacterium]